MTNEQKRAITELRLHGESHAAIAGALGVSTSAVKSFCSRNAVNLDATHNPSSGRCKQCGADVTCVPGHRAKLFCSETCRQKWWRSHKGEVTITRNVSVCEHCGASYKNGGNAERRFCSHTCYIEHRFGGHVNHA